MVTPHWRPHAASAARDRRDHAGVPSQIGRSQDPAGAIASTPSHASDTPVNIHLALAPVISLIAGILILIVPRLLSYIVAVYLIVMGLIGLFGTGALHLS
jgi:Protein of unknown function (DUF3096)